MAKTIKLGDAATFVNGYPFKPDTWTETGLPIIRIQNLNNPEAAFNHYSGPIPEKYVVRQGDILISWSASLGAYEWKGEDAYLNQHIFKVVFDKSPIDKHFLRYAVESKLAEMEKDAHGATMRHIVKKDFDNTLIPYPSIAEQKKIVAELDCLTGIIAKKKQQLEELDKLAQSIFYDMFGDPNVNDKHWRTVKFSETCKNLDYMRRPITAKDRVAGTIPYYGASGIVDWVKDFIFDGDYLLISEDGANLLMRHTPIAFCAKGKTWVNNHAHILQFEHLYEQSFMEHFINLMDISPLITGAAQPKLTQANLNSIDVFDIQASSKVEFAQKIEAIEKQKDLVKRSIVETEALFNSRMDYWFN